MAEMDWFGDAYENAAKTNKELDKTKDKLDDVADATKIWAEQFSRGQGYLDKIIEGLKQEIIELKKQEAVAAEVYARAELYLQIQDKTLEMERQQLEYKRRFENMSKDEVLRQQKILANKERDLEIARKLEGTTKSLFQTTTGISDAWENSVWGGFVGAGEHGAAAIQKAFQDTIQPANMLGSTIMKVQESTAMMVMEADNAFSSLNKMTGAAGAYDRQAMDSFRANKRFGISIDDNAQIFQAMHTQMSDFRDLTRDAQDVMAQAANEMVSLGVSTDDAATQLSLLHNVLGMNADEAARMSREMMELSLAIGAPPSEMMSAFNAAVPQLSQHGRDMTGIFKELAIQSRGLNVEIGTLIDLASQFDTFEGAAEAAGKLNALLGGDLLNSIQLLEATESERIQMLRDSLALSGKQWSAMNRFERMAIANAAGISDMNEAAKLFGMHQTEFEQYSKTQEEIKEAQDRSTAAMDKMKAVMQEFAIAVLPLLNALRWVLDVVLDINDAMGGTLVPILLVLTTVMAIAYRTTAAWNTLMQFAKVLQIGWTAAVSAFNTVKTLFIALTMKSGSAITTETAAMMTGTTVTEGYTVATASAAGATWALLAPILLIVAALAVFIGVGVLLATHIEDWTNGFMNWTDILLAAAGPIGVIALGIRKVIQNIDWFMDKLREIVSFVHAHPWLFGFPGLLVRAVTPNMGADTGAPSVTPKMRAPSGISSGISDTAVASVSNQQNNIANTVTNNVRNELGKSKRDVVLKIHERELGRATVKVIDDEYNLAKS
jgi:hypothetical protein